MGIVADTAAWAADKALGAIGIDYKGILDSDKKDIDPTRGNAANFEKGTYDIEQLQYPVDLYGNNREYGGNYVIFYINVAEDSRILKDTGIGSSLTVDASKVPSRLRGSLIGQNFNSAQVIGGAAIASALPGVLAGGAAGASGGIVGVLKGGLKGAAIGAAVGGGTAAIVSIAAGGKMARQQKRLTKAIALHVPNQLSIRYGIQWDVEETAGAQMAAVAGTEIVKAIGTLGTKSNVGGSVGNIATNLSLSKGPQGAFLSASSGIAANPLKENLFKNVDFRTFNFEYQFFPRTPAEARNVREIIHQFKLHMHPEYKDNNNFLFIYPSEFDIAYYNNGRENLNLHRHTSCVLTEMNVNYTPNGMFNSFDNGMPTQINVQLTFKELAILTKKQIEDNY